MCFTRTRKKLKLAVGLLMAVLTVQIMPVQAAETATVQMNVESYSSADRTLDVSCMLENGENVTNGKLRFKYDPNQLTLTETGAGDVMANVLTEINDCLTGNKAEGEIVGVFASANNITPDGSMFKMKFQLKDEVKEGDQIKFDVSVEKLAGDAGDVAVSVTEYTYTVEGGSGNTGGGDNTGDGDNTGGDNTGDNNGGSTGDNTGDTTGDGDNTGSGTENPGTDAGDDGSAADGDTNNGGGSAADGKDDGSGKKPADSSDDGNSKDKAAKTGDEGQFIWLACGIGALAVLCGTLSYRKIRADK